MTKDRPSSHCKVLMFAVSLFLAGCAVHASAPGNTFVTTPTSEQTSGRTVEEMAAEFRTLRSAQGHFDGGSWDDDLDQWMGRKHQVMMELGGYLATGEIDQSDLVELLGPPDEVAREGDQLLKWINDLPEFQEPGGSYSLFIYHWRGAHDFLYFISCDQQIVGSGWWYAGE